MPDYSLKAKVLSDGTYSDYRYLKSRMISSYYGHECSDRNPYKNTTVYDTAVRYNFCMQSDEYIECKRLENAKRQRVKRLHRRVTALLRKPCVFLTLTFTDKVLNSTSAKTRHDYVNRFLLAIGVPAIANIDFGSKNGREHYHSLCAIDSIDPKLWKYGNIDIKRVKGSDNETSSRLSHYIGKLTNHAIKATTRGCRVIYSGDFDSLYRS